MIEHESKEAAQQIIVDVFPNPAVRAVCVRFLAASISLASSCSTNCWGVTMSDRGLRLNVGRIEVLTLWQSDDQSLHVVIDAATVPEGLTEIEGVMLSDSPLYRSVPSSIGCDFPAGRASTILPLIASSHEAVIRMAASTPLNPSARAAYSPGIVDLLSSAENPLSHPDYFANAAQLLQSAVLQSPGIVGKLTKMDDKHGGEPV